MPHVLKTGDLDRVDHVVGALQDVEPLRGRLDGPVPSRQLDQPLRDPPGQVEADWVDVDEGEDAAVEALDGKDVGDYLAREYRAAGPDQRHLRHRLGSLPAQAACHAGFISAGGRILNAAIQEDRQSP